MPTLQYRECPYCHQQVSTFRCSMARRRDFKLHTVCNHCGYDLILKNNPGKHTFWKILIPMLVFSILNSVVDGSKGMKWVFLIALFGTCYLWMTADYRKTEFEDPAHQEAEEGGKDQPQ